MGHLTRGDDLVSNVGHAGAGHREADSLGRSAVIVLRVDRLQGRNAHYRAVQIDQGATRVAGIDRG